MTGSVSAVSAIALTVLLGWPVAVLAEPPSSSVPDDPKLPSQRRLVHPAPDPKAAERDAEEAVAVIEQRERDDELARKEAPELARRPDLDHDVVQGIQSRNVENALRQR